MNNERDNQNFNQEINMLLADFFFGCNIPFITVESIFFKRLIERLNPRYKIPTRKTIAGTILDRRFEQYIQKVRKPEVTDGVLLIDGWKNSAANSKHVVAMVRSNIDGHYTFLDSWNFSSIKETGVNLSQVVNQSVEIARRKYNINIYAVVTDNASNMVLMGRLVDLWHVTCNSHSANLLCKSLVDEAFSARVKNLLKEFKSTLLETLLIDAGESRVVLPGDTRWCSHRNSFRMCLRNVQLMRQIVNDNDIILKAENHELLFDDALEANLMDNLVILDPICKITRTCEKHTSNIADAIELWLKLELPAINEQYNNLVENREHKLINVYGLTANFLHPHYRGLRFTNNAVHMNSVNQFLNENLSENGLNELNDFKNQTGYFRDIFARNDRSWKLFWQTSEIYYPELSKLAIRLLNICAATGELERLFSQWAYVHNTKRNRLTKERSAKLITLYYGLRFRDDVLLIDEILEDSDEE